MNQLSDQRHLAECGSHPMDERFSRRSGLKAGIAAGAALVLGERQSGAQQGPTAPEKPAWRPSPLVLDRKDTALVVIDPQNDVLSERGISWPLVGASVMENNTVEHLGRLFTAAKAQDYGVFISPHFLYPHDQGWQFGGMVEKMMLDGNEFYRADPLGRDLLRGDKLTGYGADWLERFKPFIDDGKTIIASPHKAWGPQTNDLVFQLRKRRINKIILAGMLANLCVESHLRELLEEGFEVAVVKDATAAPRHPEIGDGYKAALINYGFLANAVLTTDDAVKAIQ